MQRMMVLLLQVHNSDLQHGLSVLFFVQMGEDVQFIQNVVEIQNKL